MKEREYYRGGFIGVVSEYTLYKDITSIVSAHTAAYAGELGP